LKEIGTLGSKPIYIPMNPNIYFGQNLGKLLTDPRKYRRLIGKLIYLIVTRLDITFDVGVLIDICSLYQLYYTAACRILRYLKGAISKRLYYHPSSQLDIVRYSAIDWAGNPIDHHSATGYCAFVGLDT